MLKIRYNQYDFRKDSPIAYNSKINNTFTSFEKDLISYAKSEGNLTPLGTLPQKYDSRTTNSMGNS